VRASPQSPRGLSVIIVSWNAASTIEACLDSLLAHAPDRFFEILMMDNASTDATVDLARRRGERVRITELGENRGFAAACNEGYRRSRGEYLLFLNSDIEALPAALENLCRFMDSHPAAAAAGGKLVGTDGMVQKGFNVRGFPTLVSTAFEILMVDKILPGNPVSRKQRMLDFSYADASEVDQPAGACFLVRRSVFETVGLFDERFYPAWFEDVDLCLRLRENGSKVFFVPEAAFRHRGAASLEHLAYREFLSFWYKNLLRYFEKHRGKSSTLLLRGLIVIGMSARMLAGFLVRPKPSVGRKDALAAYWRVLRETL
jgi:GT2 family glycosyltransferase